MMLKTLYSYILEPYSDKDSTMELPRNPTIYFKHNLFHQSKLRRDVELLFTHIVLFKSLREVLQINTSSQQLGLGSQLEERYQDATSIPFIPMVIYSLI